MILNLSFTRILKELNLIFSIQFDSIQFINDLINKSIND